MLAHLFKRENIMKDSKLTPKKQKADEDQSTEAVGVDKNNPVPLLLTDKKGKNGKQLGYSVGYPQDCATNKNDTKEARDRHENRLRNGTGARGCGRISKNVPVMEVKKNALATLSE